MSDPFTPGSKFGNLVVVAYVGRDEYSCHISKVRCICGTEIVTRTYNLETGRSRSCRKKGCELPISKAERAARRKAREDEIARLASTPGITHQEIADKIGTSEHAVICKLAKLGLIARKEKPPRLAPVAFPQFEDDPDGDSDKHKGRVPMRSSVQGSLTGNAGEMCVG